MAATRVTLIDPKVHDLGGFQVRRAMPSLLARHVGPFVFFDHMGPADFPPGRGIDVRPHPHIGLATVTYLFAGAIAHRDSLGSVQIIRPGDVNWMTAGRGIVHSERTPEAERADGHRLHGVQIWVALPLDAEQTDPSFHHHAAAELPQIERDGVRVRLVIGRAFGEQSPVKTFSPMFCLAAELAAGDALSIPAEYPERAIYSLDAPLQVGGTDVRAGQLVVLPSAGEVRIAAHAPARILMFGGEPLEGRRHLWWNFVSSSRERIERAKADWHEGRFASVPGDDEFIPLPDD